MLFTKYYNQFNTMRSLLAKVNCEDLLLLFCDICMLCELFLKLWSLSYEVWIGTYCVRIIQHLYVANVQLLA